MEDTMTDEQKLEFLSGFFKEEEEAEKEKLSVRPLPVIQMPIAPFISIGMISIFALFCYSINLRLTLLPLLGAFSLCVIVPFIDNNAKKMMKDKIQTKTAPLKTLLCKFIPFSHKANDMNIVKKQICFDELESPLLSI